MRSFCALTDDGRSVVVDVGIVRSDLRGFEECRAIARDVCGLQPNKSDEVMHRFRFVVQDLEEEGREDLPDSYEVGVRQFPGDRLELLEQMSEFRHNILGRHCVPRWRSCSLRGQVPPSSGSYRSIEK